jgi:integrase
MSNLGVKHESYTEEDWYVDLFKSAESVGVVRVAKIALKSFDHFCQSQEVSRQEKTDNYIKLLKPSKDDNGDYQEPDSRSVCISLNKYVTFLSENHDEIVTSTTNNSIRTFKAKSPKTIRLYFSFVKSYLKKCHGVRVSIEDIKDYVVFPKKRKVARQPLSLEQLKQIMINASPKRRALYYVLVSSGMRIGEGLTLTRSNFHFDERPVRVEIEAENTKTKEDRETYISSEAVEQMRHVLGDVFNHKQECDCFECSKMIFGYGDNPDRNVTYEDQYFSDLRVRIGKKLNQKPSTDRFDGEGFFKKYKNSIRYVVNIHAMRSYFITKASMKHGETYSHALSGHGSYLKEYNRISKEEKSKLYLELESDLFIESVKTETDKVNAEENMLIKQQMAKLQIEMEKLKKYPQTA